MTSPHWLPALLMIAAIVAPLALAAWLVERSARRRRRRRLPPLARPRRGAKD